MSATLITGRQRLTVDDTVRTPTVPSGTRRALLTFENAAVRYTFEGTDPVAGTDASAVGHLANAADAFILGSEELHGLKLLRNTGTSGIVEFTYYGS